MINIKTLFRPSTVSASMMKMYYYVKIHDTFSYIPTSVLLPQTSCQRIKSNRNLSDLQLHAVRQKIRQDFKRLININNHLHSLGKPYTADDVMNIFLKKKSSLTFTEYMSQCIRQLHEEQRYGTARNYQAALNSFRAFLGDDDICFESLTDGVVIQYEKFLSDRGISRNSSSFYIRILRAVFRKAERKELTSGHLCRFSLTYTGVDRTPKRALPEQMIKAMYHLNLQNDPAMALARDLFIFSYCARGMSFVDMAFLKKTDITDGIIAYARRKTHQQLYIKIEKPMLTIIQRYQQASDRYVFPIIKAESSVSAYSEYAMSINHYNYMLKRIGQLLQYNGTITSYSARHSWATIALHHNIPINLISQGLGHESERTTRIYLAMNDNRSLDTANSTIIHSLLH